MKNYFLINLQIWKRKTFLSLFTILGTILCSYGQATNASIKGKVTDRNGEPLMGATIIVKNNSTGFTSGSITNENGSFKIQQLPLGGPYTLTSQYLGFQDIVKEGFMLNLSDALTVEAKSKIYPQKVGTLQDLLVYHLCKAAVAST